MLETGRQFDEIVILSNRKEDLGETHTVRGVESERWTNFCQVGECRTDRNFRQVLTSIYVKMMIGCHNRCRSHFQRRTSELLPAVYCTHEDEVGSCLLAYCRYNLR